MLDRTPKVFISYSWTSEDYQNRVIEFATRLRQQHSVDVKLDVWDLKAGQDTYKFMEQCVTNPDIDRVLIHQRFMVMSHRKNLFRWLWKKTLMVFLIFRLT